MLVFALLIGAMLLVPAKLTRVKMLPFDNKSELQVVIDTPEGTSLEETAAATRQISEYLKRVPEVFNYQTYTGTSAPFNFNGLVRHYFLRSASNQADIQVNFVAKDERKRRATTSRRGSDHLSRPSRTNGTHGRRSWRYPQGRPC